MCSFASPENPGLLETLISSAGFHAGGTGRGPSRGEAGRVGRAPSAMGGPSALARIVLGTRALG